MGNSAYVKLVEDSTTQEISLEDVKQKMDRYIEMTSKTGQQLDWDYAGAAFPYNVVEKEEAEGKWFYLKGKDPKLYQHIVIGVGSETIVDEEEENAEKERHYIQVVLPEGATHGDVAKANEFCKYLAKEFKAQLLLFNGRTMYYYPRKP